MSESVPVIVPQENPNDEHAVLVDWLVASGDEVTEGQALVTLETTKASFDVQAPRAGYVYFEHEPKTMVAVGAAVAWISDEKGPPKIVPPTGSTQHAKSAGGASAESGERHFSRKALKLMEQHGLTADDFP
jgi:pyruvate/2-oxoglutarate dehydrogenase complex dihydrolipoamide acyltransferase (E2) component